MTDAEGEEWTGGGDYAKAVVRPTWREKWGGGWEEMDRGRRGGRRGDGGDRAEVAAIRARLERRQGRCG